MGGSRFSGGCGEKLGGAPPKCYCQHSQWQVVEITLPSLGLQYPTIKLPPTTFFLGCNMACVSSNKCTNWKIKCPQHSNVTCNMLRGWSGVGTQRGSYHLVVFCYHSHCHCQTQLEKITLRTSLQRKSNILSALAIAPDWTKDEVTTRILRWFCKIIVEKLFSGVSFQDCSDEIDVHF